MHREDWSASRLHFETVRENIVSENLHSDITIDRCAAIVRKRNRNSVSPCWPCPFQVDLTGHGISAQAVAKSLFDAVNALRHRQVVANKLCQSNLLKATLQIDRYTAICKIFEDQAITASISQVLTN